MSAASVRFRAPSFRKMADTCAFTVPLAKWRDSAISLLVIPWARSERTTLLPRQSVKAVEGQGTRERQIPGEARSASLRRLA